MRNSMRRITFLVFFLLLSAWQAGALPLSTPSGGAQANISGCVLVNVNGIFFSDSACATPNVFGAGLPNTGSYDGQIGGTIQNLTGTAVVGTLAKPLVDFATFTNPKGNVFFDLQTINPGFGTAAGCLSDAVGSICTLPGSPITLIQLTAGSVAISLNVSGQAYLGSSGTGTTPTTALFTSQNVIPGTITAIIAAALSPAGFQDSFGAVFFSATPVTVNCAVINAVAGVAITPVILVAAGGAGGPYTFTATGLPPGITVSSSGTISGTPMASGTFNYTVTVKDVANTTGMANCSVTVITPPPNLTSCVLPYPTGNPPLLSSVVFNESGVLQDFEQSSDTTQLRAWFTDEHAPLLGARSVTVVTSGGSTTTTYPFTEFNSTTLMAYNPAAPLAVGDTIEKSGSNGVAGVDTALQFSQYNFGNGIPSDWSGRPLWPSLFVTDLTVNGMSSIAGDWQQGGTTAVPPNGIFGEWKGATVTYNETQSPPLMTVTTDADPPAIAGNGRPPGIPDTPSTGFGQNLGYFTEATWNVSTLGLIPGHAYRIQVIVHDGDQNKSGGDVGEACLTPVYIPVFPLALPTSSLPGGNYGNSYTASVGATGGVPKFVSGVATYTYSITGGSLPPGLSLNTSTGAITGIPQSVDVGNSYPFTVMVTDSAGSSVSQAYSITIGAELPLVLTCLTTGTTGLVGSPFSSPAPTISGGVAPYTFSIKGGPAALPAGLTLNTSTGAITGTPTTIGSFTLQATDNMGALASTSCSYTINSCLLPDLGAAASFSILGLDNAKVNIQTSVNDSGTVGIGAGGTLHVQGNSALKATSVLQDPTATVQIDKGASLTPMPTSGSFSSIQSAALAANAFFAGLTPTQTFSAPINSGLTLTGNGGQNVIAVNGQVNLNNSGNLTISGGPGDFFVFNIAAGQNFQLQNGSSIVLNGISPSQVVFNFLGNSSTPAPPGPGPAPGPGGNLQVQSGPQGASNTAGIFLDPSGQINIQGGTHNSTFISGNQIQFQSGPGGPPPGTGTSVTVNAVTCPGPPALTLSCPAKIGDPSASYMSAFTAIGGMAPYTFGFSGTPSLTLDGLTLNSSTGGLTGTLPGTLPITFTGKVTDANSNTVNSPQCTIGLPCLLKTLGLGSDATTTFSILGISGSNQNNPQINIQTAIGGTGSIGVGVNVQLQVNGPGINIANTVYKDTSATVKLGGGDSIPTPKPESFSAIQSMLLTESTALGSLTPTQTFNQINTSTTITGNGGQNVIAINGPINLNNGQNLVFSGGKNDTFIVNVQQGQNIHLQNGAGIVLTGGVTSSQVLFNFLGNGGNVQIQSGPPGSSNTAGIFLDPGGQIQIQGGSHNSLFISGNQIQVQPSPQGNPTFTAPACQ